MVFIGNTLGVLIRKVPNIAVRIAKISPVSSTNRFARLLAPLNTNIFVLITPRRIDINDATILVPAISNAQIIAFIRYRARN